MALLYDYNHTYKNSLRFLLVLKLNKIYCKNTYNIPYMSCLSFFFSLSKAIDKDNISILNYFYLFKFFFGKNAFLSKYKSFYNLGNWFFNFKVFIIINKKDIYPTLFYYINDFIYIIDNINFRYGIYSSKYNIFYILLKDLTSFSERKTNIALFNLNDTLNLHLFFSGGNLMTSKIILNNFKLKKF